MRKIFRITNIVTVATIPVIFAISCGHNSPVLPVDETQAIFLKDGDIQRNPNRAHILMPEILRQKIKTYNQDLSASFGVPLVSGGFGEVRHFYSTKNKLSIHMGDDVFVKAQTKIYAPYDGEIIASWGKSKVGELGGGFGNQVVMKVKVKDMNLSKKAKEVFKDEENAFLTFEHLSHKTPWLLTDNVDEQQVNYKKDIWNWSYNTDIMPQHTLKVKKGQIIGEVGALRENGGWVPHVHVEVYKGSSKHFASTRINKYTPKDDWTQQEFMKNYRMFSSIKGIGVYMLSRGDKNQLMARFNGGDYDYEYSFGKNKGKIVKKHIDPKKSFRFTSGIVDPNLIYKLWTKTSKEFILK